VIAEDVIPERSEVVPTGRCRDTVVEVGESCDELLHLVYPCAGSDLLVVVVFHVWSRADLTVDNRTSRCTISIGSRRAPLHEPQRAWLDGRAPAFGARVILDADRE